MRKLPVFQSFKEVYSGVFAHFFELLRVAWLPLAISLLISALASWWLLQYLQAVPVLTASEMGGLSQEDAKAVQAAQMVAFLKMMPWVSASLFLQFIVMSAVAVGFHRFVLLGERHRGWGGTGFGFGRNELVYIWSMIKIGFVGLIAVLVLTIALGMIVGGALFVGGTMDAGASGLTPALIGTILGYVVIAVVLLFVMSRLSIVLPHVALGNPSRIRFIWNTTKGNSWRLAAFFALVALCAALASAIAVAPLDLLLGIPLMATQETVRDLAASPWKFALRFVVSIPLTLAWAMLTVTMLSVAYREIVGLPADGVAASEAAPA